MPSPAQISPTLRPHEITLHELQARAALHHLVTAYCHGIDRRDYGLLRTLYHADAVDDHSPMYCGPAEGFVDWLPSILETWSATAHTLSNLLFLIDGDFADGELCAMAYHRTRDETREFIAHGRYLDQYERRDGLWKFSKRSFVLDWSEERVVSGARNVTVEGVTTGQAGPTDPCYMRLPRFARDRASRG